VLESIKRTGDIFFAQSDREWVLDGAAVHVSMVGFDAGTEKTRAADGEPADQINADLTTSLADVSRAVRLRSNLGQAFMGDTKGGAFDIAFEQARDLLLSPNPHGRPNSDVVVPWINGLDVTRRLRHQFIIDFGVEAPESTASRYELPFEHVKANVKPARDSNKRAAYRDYWWIHVEARPGMRKAFATNASFIGTARVSKHRLFARFDREVLPDSQVIVFGLSNDQSLGLLCSRVHEVWALERGTQLETRPRYTPTTCFETFPFPQASAPLKHRWPNALESWTSCARAGSTHPNGSSRTSSSSRPA
jgi:hypothetical protein